MYELKNSKKYGIIMYGCATSMLILERKEE